MTLAILYTTRYGSTRSIAETIADRLRDAFSGVQIVDVNRRSDLPEADVVLIGSPIYGGSTPRAMRAFVDAHLDELLSRRVGLYLSCFYDGTRAEQQLADNVPPRLVAHSFGAYFPGGTVTFSRLRWIDRLLMKKIAGVNDDVDRRNEAEIDRLVSDVTRIVG